jgi:hypothetical protein
MRLVHRPTAVRVAALSAALTLVLYALVSLSAPTLVDLVGADVARGAALVAGLVVRLLAGRSAARHAWRAGADLTLVAVSVLAGGLLGWLIFPGLLSLVGVLDNADVALGVSGLLLDLTIWQVCLLVGAISGGRGRLGPTSGRRWALRPTTARGPRP